MAARPPRPPDRGATTTAWHDARYARAAHPERIAVGVGLAAAELTVSVTDDGRGGAEEGGSGLSGLRERVEALGGSLRVTSSGGGTTVEAGFPLGS